MRQRGRNKRPCQSSNCCLHSTAHHLRPYLVQGSKLCIYFQYSTTAVRSLQKGFLSPHAEQTIFSASPHTSPVLQPLPSQWSFIGFAPIWQYHSCNRKTSCTLRDAFYEHQIRGKSRPVTWAFWLVLQIKPRMHLAFFAETAFLFNSLSTMTPRSSSAKPIPSFLMQDHQS